MSIVVVLAMVTTVLAPVLIPVLLTSGRVTVGTTELFGAIPAVVLGATFRRSLGEIEWVNVRRLRLLQVAHVIVAGAATYLPCLIVIRLIGVGWDPIVATNGMAFLGLVLLIVRWNELPYWSLAVMVAGITYLLGKNPDTGVVHVWAWLLWKDNDALQLTLNLAVFLVGALSFATIKNAPDDASD